MPYIPTKDRGKFTRHIDGIDAEITNLGELNYIITRLLYKSWLRSPHYITICQIIGTLICVAFEFYRRVAHQYEDQKRGDNGDVYI